MVVYEMYHLGRHLFLVPISRLILEPCAWVGYLSDLHSSTLANEGGGGSLFYSDSYIHFLTIGVLFLDEGFTVFACLPDNEKSLVVFTNNPTFFQFIKSWKSGHHLIFE